MKVYADNAATTKVSDGAMAAMLPCFQTHYGNPSSIYELGEEAAQILEDSRTTIAHLIGAVPQEIYFTSGGTEADNWALTAAATAGKKQGKTHIISSAFEHHAILHTLEKLEKQGFEITLVPVSREGRVDPQSIEDAIRRDTCLVTIMYANNEIGTIQPIEEIGRICRQKGVTFHTDAVQAAGYLEIDVAAQSIDMLSLSAHKFHGPKGVGILYCRKGVPLQSFIEGGAQERGKRGGTENVPAIAGMAAALSEAVRNRDENNKRISALRDTLIKALSALPSNHYNGSPGHQLPGVVNFCFEGIEGEALLLMLNMKGISASSGSACTSGSLDPSHVLLALGLPHAIAHGSLRLSLSEYNTAEEIDYILTVLPPIIERLRDMSPVWEHIERGDEDGIQ